MTKTVQKPNLVKQGSLVVDAASNRSCTKKTSSNQSGNDSSALSTKGLGALCAAASHHNIDPLEFFVLCSAILRGIAGKSEVLKIGRHVESVPFANLVFSSESGALMRSVQYLASSASLLQDQLIQSKLSNCSKSPLDRKGLARSHSSLQNSQIGRLRQIPINAGYLASMLSQMPPEVASQEATEHPRFLVNGLSMDGIKDEIESCHQCRCLLIAPKVDDAQADSRTLDKLSDLLNGTTGLDQRHQNKVIRPVDRLHAQIIGPASMDWLHQVEKLGHPVLGNFIFLDRNPGDGCETDYAQLDDFTKWVQIICTKLLEARMKLQFHQVSLQDANASHACLRMEAIYQQKCDDLTHDPGPGVRGIPRLLLWSMGLYRQHFNAFPDERDLVKWAYSAAAEFINRNKGILFRIKQTVATQSELRTADRIVEIIQEIGPKKAWELRRHFDCQRKDDFEPLLKNMTDLGCLASKNQIFTIGTVPYDQVRPQLADTIRKSVPFEIFPDVSVLVDKKEKAINSKTKTANTAKKKHRPAA